MPNLSLSRRGLFGIGAAFIAAPAIVRVSWWEANGWMDPGYITEVEARMAQERIYEAIVRQMSSWMTDKQRRIYEHERLKMVGRFVAGIALDA